MSEWNNPGFKQHRQMKQYIGDLFPDLREGQRIYIQNKTSNILRHLGDDIIEVWVTPYPINPAQYCTSRTFTVGKDVTVYVTIQVD
jgi:hypothetical protein